MTFGYSTLRLFHVTVNFIPKLLVSKGLVDYHLRGLNLLDRQTTPYECIPPVHGVSSVIKCLQ